MPNINDIKITVRQAALEFWKPSMVISDFYIIKDRQRYQLSKVINYQISKNAKTGIANVEFYDARINRILTTSVEFEFKNSQLETIEHLTNDETNFSFNLKKLKTFEFISFSKKDVRSHHPNVEIEKVSIKEWSIFQGKIAFKVDLLIFRTYKKSIVVTKKLTINIASLIKKLLSCDTTSSLLKVNSFSEFEVLKFAPMIRSYHLFFGKSDYKKLFEIVDEIEVINPKILTTNLDIFSEKSISYFNSGVNINGHYFKRFIFKSQYDARYLQTTIINKLIELPLRSSIQGRPRTVDINLKHLYKNYNKTYFHVMFAKNGISDILDSNVDIKIYDYNFQTNKASIELAFKKAPQGTPLIFKKRLPFEKQLSSFVSYQFKEQDFIELKNKALLEQHPIFLPQLGDFEIKRIKTIKILDVSSDPISMLTHWAKYKFKLLDSDPHSQITFDYEQEIYFACSRLEYLFNKLDKTSLDITALAKKSDRYYYQIGDRYSKTWAPIFDKTLISSMKFHPRYNETDFEIVKLEFRKDQLFSKKLLFLMTIESKLLDDKKVIKLNIELVKKVLVGEFNRLQGNDIKLVNDGIIASYPIPILNVDDFYVKFPFEILEMTTRYNEHNSSIECTFIVSIADMKKTIKNVFYFANDAMKRFETQSKQSELLFQAINKNDIFLNYDENSNDYFINPNVSVEVAYPTFFVKINNWQLKSWWRKLVALNIAVSYRSETKYFTKLIRFKKRIKWRDYQAWKEANYAFE